MFLFCRNHGRNIRLGKRDSFLHRVWSGARSAFSLPYVWESLITYFRPFTLRLIAISYFNNYKFYWFHNFKKCDFILRSLIIFNMSIPIPKIRVGVLSLSVTCHTFCRCFMA